MNRQRGWLWSLGWVVLAGLGCSSDDADAPDDDSVASLLGLGEDDGPFDSCKDFLDFPPDVPHPTGQGHFSSPADDNDPAFDMDLIEVTCETRHDAQGATTGYFASFFASWEASDDTPLLASVALGDAFDGDGTYMANLHRNAAPLDHIGNYSGTLVLSEGGRVGSFTDGAGVDFTYACGDSSKLSMDTRAPAPQAEAGTLQVPSSDGDTIYTFPGIRCGLELSEDFEISTGLYDAPFQATLLLNGNGNGSHTVNRTFLSFDYAGNNDFGSVSISAVNLSCGSPSSGTVDYTYPGGTFTGAFRCAR